MLHDFQDLTEVIYDRSEQYVKVGLLTYVRCKWWIFFNKDKHAREDKMCLYG